MAIQIPRFQAEAPSSLASPGAQGIEGLGEIIGSIVQAKRQAEAAKVARERQAKMDELTTQEKQANIKHQQTEDSLLAPTYDAPPALKLPPGSKLTRKELLSWQEKQAELDANRGTKNDAKQVGYANQFRDEFNQVSKPFLTVAPMYKNVKASAETPNPTAATDMNMIFAYMKILDPNSTVREGEYATAAKAGSFGDQVRNAVSQLENGQKLTPEQRANFLSSAGAAYQSAAALQAQHVRRYTDLAKRRGVDPADVVYDWSEPTGAVTPPAPPRGAAPGALAQPGAAPKRYKILSVE